MQCKKSTLYRVFYQPRYLYVSIEQQRQYWYGAHFSVTVYPGTCLGQSFGRRVNQKSQAVRLAGAPIIYLYGRVDDGGNAYRDGEGGRGKIRESNTAERDRGRETEMETVTVTESGEER